MISLRHRSVWRSLGLSAGILAVVFFCPALSRAEDESEPEPSSESPSDSGSSSELAEVLGSEYPLFSSDSQHSGGSEQTDDLWDTSSHTPSTACYQMTFSIGPWIYGGPDVNFGYQTPDFGATVTNGIEYTHDANGYILDAGLVVPLGGHRVDTLIIGVEYSDAENTAWTNRANTAGGNYFASLPIVADPANARLGSVFNGISSADMRISTNNVSVDILGARHFRAASFGNAKCVDWQLQAGVTIGAFQNTTEISIVGNESGSTLTETGRYEIDSFRVGPVLGIVRTTDFCLRRLGITGELDVDLTGRLNIGSDRLSGIQRQNGPTAAALMTDRTLRATVRETTFSPEFVTGMTLRMPLYDRMIWSLGWDFHVMFGTPVLSTPSTSPGAAYLEPTSDFSIANQIYYAGSVKFGVQY